jgi:hypothetical protein
MHLSLQEYRCLSVLPAQKKLKFALRFSRSVSITAQTDANTNVDAEREDPPRIQFSLSAYSFPFSSFLLIVCSHRLTAGRVLLRREAGLLWGSRKDVEPGDASLDSLAQQASVLPPDSLSAGLAPCWQGSAKLCKLQGKISAWLPRAVTHNLRSLLKRIVFLHPFEDETSCRHNNIF